ncbi:hypothetical protein RQP46_011149 [Phenoliferia psychrophenolica]
MATIHSLPSEILFDILELAHDPREPSTMCAAALVCRAWRAPAQRALFLDIAVPMVFRDPTKERVRSRRWSDLLSTRNLSPRRVELWVPSGSTNEVISARSFWLRACSGVRELSIQGGELQPDFLSDSNLRDRLVQAYQSLTPLVSLTLDIRWRPDDSKSFPTSDLIPTTISDLSIILTVPNDAVGAPLFFTSVQNLHHLTLLFGNIKTIPPPPTPPIPAFIDALVGSLPSSLKRLGLKNVGGTFPLLQTPFKQIRDLFSGGGLPNLARIDFPDCKREDLEKEAAAADLVAECERRSIRIVCWEEFV